MVMAYRIEVTKAFSRKFQALPKNAQRTIEKKIELLALDPYARNNNVKRLEGRSGYRLRVGDWRVIYDLNDATVTLLLLEIGARGGIYK
jgi:mRNA interferase RelE/StbE